MKSCLKEFSKKWHIILGTIFIIGVILFGISIIFNLPKTLKSISLVVGILLFSAPQIHYITFIFLCKIRPLYDLHQTEDNKNHFPAAITGLFESIMYPIAILYCYPEFIGLWLAIKVAADWVAWGSDKRKRNGSNAEGRRRFHHFLVGNALVIILSFITYLILKLLLRT